MSLCPASKDERYGLKVVTIKKYTRLMIRERVQGCLKKVQKDG